MVTAGRGGFQLFLNGHLQFSSADEYRYHEALVHPAMALAGRPRRVLVLGGGDGLALREILKIPSVEAVTLVDLDPDMTGLSDRFQAAGRIERPAPSHDPRVEVVNQDAMIWLDRPGPAYDVAIVDFPDPNSFAVGKLYTTRFYRLLQQRLAPEGAVACNALRRCSRGSRSGASFARWRRPGSPCGPTTPPCRRSASGVLPWPAAVGLRDSHGASPPGLKFLTPQSLPGLFALPADLGPLAVEVNRLDNQSLVRYHDIDWKHWE